MTTEHIKQLRRQNAKKWETQKIKEGCCVVRTLLEPEAIDALKILQSHFKIKSKKEIINRAIVDFKEKIKENHYKCLRQTNNPHSLI